MITTNYLPEKKDVFVDFDTDIEKYLYQEYDYYKKNIYQGFNALRNNSLYDNLLGNVMFCTLGIKDYFKIDEEY